MALIRWEPFATSDFAFNRMPSAFGRLARWPAENELEAGREWLPSTDISETDKEFLIRAELPAIKKEDVRVTAEDGMIRIEGERKQQSEQKDERFHRMESCYGSFSRSFSLPENINSTAIRCESRDGVLTVHIPKKVIEKPQPRQIKVE
jgi:HSP20 family protein